MRLIDADVSKEKIIELLEIEWGYESIREDVSRIIDSIPTVEELSHEKWEYLKEHITELRDANGYATQYGTCQFILNLMDVIEKEGEAE